MKRWSLILVALLLSLLLVACSGTGEGGATTAPSTESTEAPVGESTDAPEGESTDAPEGESTDAPEGESTDAPEEGGTDAPEEGSTDAPEEGSTDAPEEGSTDAPEEGSTGESTDDTAPEVHEHRSVTHVEALAPTCSEDGNVEYWQCGDCGERFSDAACTLPLTGSVTLDATGHAWGTGEVIQVLSCTVDGETKFTCGTCSATKTETETAPGHDWSDNASCEEGRVCGVCKTEEPAQSHDYQVSATEEGDCTTPPSVTYTCQRDGCKDSYVDVLGTAPGHATVGVTPSERHVSGCEYELVYVCRVCHESVAGDRVFHHEYRASITRAATCREDGVKTLACACGDSYTEAIEKNATGHAWTAGSVVSGKRTDTCSTCNETKSVTVVEGTTTEKTAASELANTEIEVNNANVSLDQGVVDALGEKEVTLSVGKVEGDARKDLPGMDETKLAQVGKNPIYDFTISDGTSNISEFGKENFVTITVPYELTEGEDVDSIAVWFINDKGELEAIDAVYNNGFVTFRTNHFSYYTVTRLTPEQRCEAWGHSERVTTVPVSCVSDGYTLSVCVRCHATEKVVTETAWGHKYTETVTPATCTKSGSVINECERCDDFYASRIKATGHAWEESGRESASCEKHGFVSYVCTNEACGETYREILPRLKHVYRETAVPATCTGIGYTEHVCEVCGYSWRDAFVSALGHDMTSSVTPPTCVEDGYTLHSCSRCDHTVKDTPVKAPGHKLSVSETPATCTVDGSRVESCSACDYEKRETLTAPGHSYVSTVTAPTCEAEGYTTHVCSVCRDSYVDARREKLGHAYFSTTVPPSCETDGYTEHVCRRCSDTYRDAETPAVGHDFSASWTWSEERDAATLTLVCRYNGAHRHELSATVTSVTEEATCEAEGSRTYTATAAHDGKNYSDTKRETLAKLPHTPAQTHLYNETHHWLECTVCSTPEQIYEHDHSERILVQDATCTLPGSLRLVCVCGHERTESVPATGEHVYENGVCTGCGRLENDACDHTALYERELDLGALGYCDWMLTYLSCSCGEVLSLDEHSLSKAPCKMSMGEQWRDTDDDGTEWAHMNMTCSECGLCLLYSQTAVADGCTYTVTVVYDFYSPDGEAVIVGLTARSEQTAHSLNYSTVELADYGFCGGTAYVGVCERCNEVHHVSDLQPACKNAVFGEDSNLGEDGIEHTVFSFSCPDCSLYATVDQWSEPVNECLTEYFERTTVKRGEETLLSGTLSMTGGEHSYEYTYELLGESCEDGLRVHRLCKRCGTSGSMTTESHYTERVEIDLGEYTPCGGRVALGVCVACHETVDVYDVSYGCVFKEGGTEESPEEKQTAARHTACAVCGMEKQEETWTEQGEGCDVSYFQRVRLVMEGEEILSWTQSITFADHAYSYEYTLEGDGCEDGYTYVATCTRCGVTHDGEDYGHRWNENEIDTAQLGACHGTIRVNTCEVCGKTDYHAELGCSGTWSDPWSSDPFDGPLTETLYGEAFTCRACNYTYVFEYVTNTSVPCLWEKTESLRIRDPERNDVFYVEKTYTEDHHAFDVSAEYLEGSSSCEDGMHVTQTCSVCGESRSFDWYGCYEVLTETDLSMLGMCGGKIERISCIACDRVVRCETRDVPCEWEKAPELAPTYGESASVCTRCGVIYVFSSELIGPDASCVYLDTQRHAYYMDGELLVEAEFVDAYTEHTYEYSFLPHGESCEDGVTVTATCTHCKDFYDHEISWHQRFITAFYDFSEHADCEGYLRVESCPCGRETGVDWYLPSCVSRTSYSEDADGNRHTLEEFLCEGCDTVVLCDTYGVRDGCTVTYYRTYSVTCGGETVVPAIGVVGESGVEHISEYVFSMNGESCTEGFTASYVCTLCGEVETEEYYDWHCVFTTRYVDLEQLGACYGYFSEYSCPCGEERGIDYNYCWDHAETEETTDESGVMHTVETYTCGNCATVVVRDTYPVRKGCTLEWTEAYTVNVDGENVIEDARRVSHVEENAHLYSYTYEFVGTSCEEGVTEIATCDNCGESFREYYDWHVTRTVEYTDLSKHGACWGTLEIYVCPCGRGNGTSLNFCTTDWMPEEGYTDGDGVWHDVSRRFCTDCGLEASCDSYTVTDGCYSETRARWDLSVGGTAVLDGWETVTSHWENHEYHYVLTPLGETCYDGYEALGTCISCGATEKQTGYSHDIYTTFCLDLSAAGACYGVAQRSGCACGLYENTDVGFCWSEYESGDVTYGEDGSAYWTSVYRCPECGIEGVAENVTVKNGCAEDTVRLWSITLDGEVLLENFEQAAGTSYVHDYAYSFDVWGETCYDGYTAYGVCRDCGETCEEEGDFHNYYRLKDFRMQDLGLCEGARLFLEGCPCGESAQLYTVFCDGATVTSGWESDSEGNESYYERGACELCGGFEVHTVTRGVLENCKRSRVCTVTFKVGEEEIETFSYQGASSEEHDYAGTPTLTGESCEDGVLWSFVCRGCGTSYEETMDYHKTISYLQWDLAQMGACYGYFAADACACGAEQNAGYNFCWDGLESDSYTDGEGRVHSVEDYTCSVCGHHIRVDSYEVRDPAACKKTVYSTVTVSFGGEQVASASYRTVTEAHDLIERYTLSEGVDSCDGGYLLSVRCANCDYGWEDIRYAHDEYPIEEYDLRDYGSVCGGKLVIFSCPCGERAQGILTDMACETDMTYLDSCWVEGTVYSASAYEYVCAVTDPACTLVYRFADYYLPEGCMAVHYQTWRLGYDRATGTYQKEITVAPGDYHVWHAWGESTYCTGSDEHGDWQGYRQECGGCGSYNEEKFYYDEYGERVRYEFVECDTSEDTNVRLRTNVQEFARYTENDGQTVYLQVLSSEEVTYVDGNVRFTRTEYTHDYGYRTESGESGYLSTQTYSDSNGNLSYREEAYVYLNGIQYPHYSYERIGADGSEWSRYEYVYGDTPCDAVRIYTDWTGACEETSVTNHATSHYQCILPATCTQDGVWGWVCEACECVFDESAELPLGHSWQYSEDLGCYVCQTCGLENENGADGDVILEDLTGEYGGGEDFVVGYYAPWGTSMEHYVTLRLTDGTGEEIVIDVPVTRHASLRALVFSRAKVEAAAEALGYQLGDYYAVLTFVPTDAEGQLDYAIVLTSSNPWAPDNF